MSNVSSGSGGSPGSSQPTNVIQLLRQVDIGPGLEALIGTVMAGTSVPAMARVRLLSTVAPPSAHASIKSEGLIPRSLRTGIPPSLTPKIPAFEADAMKRIFLGGFTSSTVYSNMHAMSVLYPNGAWVKAASKNILQCAFLFVPSGALFKTPLVAVVPERVFMQNFVKDEYSIVKVLATQMLGSWKAPVPGAYKSVPDFILAPKYFVGSSHFSPKEILWEGVTSSFHSPWRFVRGCTFGALGPCLVWNAWTRWSGSSSQ